MADHKNQKLTSKGKAALAPLMLEQSAAAELRKRRGEHSRSPLEQELINGERLRDLIRSMPDLDKNREFMFPDSFACEHFFLRGFLNERMSIDFPHIARDFFANEAAGLLSYEYVAYVDAHPGEFGPVISYEFWFLDLIYCAYKQGSSYSKDLLLYLYKTYFRKEYQQLKRFKRLTDKEVLALAGENPEAVSRTLCMAKIMGIAMDATCVIFFPWLTSLYEERITDELRFGEFTPEDYGRAIDEACELFLTRPEIMDLRDMYLRFLDQAFENHDYGDYRRTMEEQEEREALEDLTRTLLVLEKCFPGRTFSAEHLAGFSVLYHGVKICVKGTNFTRMYFEEMAGTRDLSEYFVEPSMFRPEQVGSVVTNVHVERAEEEEIPDNAKEVPEGIVEQLQREIDELRFKVHAGETEVKRLNGLVRDHARRNTDLQKQLERLQDERSELYTLREYVYSLTEEETEPEEEIDYDALEREIAEHDIVIIGGNRNWVKKLQQKFPKWVYLSSCAVKTESFRVLYKAERVYFFTETLGHSQYDRYIREVRDNNIPYSYIRGVNLKNNIAQIYRDLMK